MALAIVRGIVLSTRVSMPISSKLDRNQILSPGERHLQARERFPAELRLVGRQEVMSPHVCPSYLFSPSNRNAGALRAQVGYHE